MNDDKIEQLALFDCEEDWRELWRGMPEYNHNDMHLYQSIIVHFRTQADKLEFARLIEQQITDETKSIYYPKVEVDRDIIRYYDNSDSKRVNKTRYPIFVISKGRADSRLTVKALEEMNVPFKVVIEPQEFDEYASVINPEKILILPFSNLGLGGIPARNWVWDYSISIGAEKHWILDDNIDGFIRQNNNKRIRVKTSACFNAIEDFVDRYENIALAGMNYRFLGGHPASKNAPPFLLNTRIYSCILIKNDIPYRWRGRYNEDTDLSLRALKDGYCTVLFNAFKINKMATMTMSGGNSDELYKDDGRLKMAQSLVEQHPDVTRVSWKWGRYQHHVDYRAFKNNKLKLKDNIVVPDSTNDYGMILKEQRKGD